MGRTVRRKRDGTRPFKGSYRARKGLNGRRQAAGLKCPNK